MSPSPFILISKLLLLFSKCYCSFPSRTSNLDQQVAIGPRPSHCPSCFSTRPGQRGVRRLSVLHSTLPVAEAAPVPHTDICPSLPLEEGPPLCHHCSPSPITAPGTKAVPRDMLVEWNRTRFQRGPWLSWKSVLLLWPPPHPEGPQHPDAVGAVVPDWMRAVGSVPANPLPGPRGKRSHRHFSFPSSSQPDRQVRVRST